MTLVKVRRAAQITLPAEMRSALRVSEGDYLEAELVEGGVLLRPVAIFSREQAAKPLDEQEREIQEVVSEARREHAAAPRRP